MNLEKERYWGLWLFRERLCVSGLDREREILGLGFTERKKLEIKVSQIGESLGVIITWVKLVMII